MEKDHPFVVGARVAYWPMGRRYGGTPVEKLVAKVYKTGRFLLEGSTQQWRAHSTLRDYGNPASGLEWRAVPTASIGYHPESVMLWDEATDAEIRAEIAGAVRRNRIAAIRHRVERLKSDDITEDALSQIEAALAVGMTVTP